mmetsp:Transcript_21877/g.76765  ORF Transcript_21877/g.76765 Transcript_21877/m.76765 type:complete len:350 (-) Transcript_21877:26-1075(-)
MAGRDAREAEEEVARLQQDFEDSLRVAGLKRGQENALVGDLGDLRRATRRWVTLVEDEGEATRRRASDAEERAAKAEAERDAAEDSRTKLSAEVRRLAEELRDTEAAAETAATTAEERRRRDVEAVAEEHREWKQTYLESSQAAMEKKIAEVRAVLVQERDRAVEATLARMEEEYRAARTKAIDDARAAERVAATALSQAEEAHRRREEAEKSADEARTELARVKEAAAAAATAAEESEYAIRKRLADVTYRLKVLQMEVKAKEAAAGLKEEKENHALDVAASAHRKEVARMRDAHLEALDAVERRVQRVLAEKAGVIKALQDRLADESSRADRAERMLRQLDDGLRGL